MCPAQASPQFVYQGVDSNGVQLYDVTWDTLGSQPFAVRVLAPDHPSTELPTQLPLCAASRSWARPSQRMAVVWTNSDNSTCKINITRRLSSRSSQSIRGMRTTPLIQPSTTRHSRRRSCQPGLTVILATGGTDKNLLIGFSKSGYGALDLLFKHSSTFDAAAAWDFPADMATYDAFGSSSSGDYGTDANFQNNYRMTGNFIDTWKAPFTTEDRIWISGYDVFQADVADFDALLTSHGVLNTLSPQTLNAHTWSGGWLPSAVAGLYGLGQVDTTPPTETISTTINTDTGATGTITSGGVTKDNTLGLSGTVSDAGGVSSVQIYDGATLLGPATISSGNWSYTTPALLAGSHSFTAKATDNAGNTTTTSAVTATVDTAPPTETISTTINTDTGATGTITSGGVTKDNTLGLSGTVSDAGGVSSVQIYDGATLLGPATVSSGNWSYTTPALLAGSHSFTAKATDNAGNTTTTSAVTATVDTTPPTETISTTINTDTGATGTITSGGVTKDNTLGLSGTVSDAGGVSSVQIYDGATLLGPATVSSGNWSYTTAALLAGSHSFTAKATDNAGNTTTTSAVTATVDTTPPTETISTTINTDTGATGTITSGGVTKDNTLGLSGTVSDAGGVSSVQIYDGATLLGPATVSSGNWSYTTAALLAGSHSFTAKATDNAGNTTTTSAVTATVDTTPPTETISTTINTDTGATGTITSGGVTKDNTLGLSGTVSDAGGVSSVQIYDGATLLGPATVSSGNWSYTTAALLAGSHSFTAKATDNAGNTTTTSAVTATVDTTPPTETISTTINTDTGATGTITSGGVTKDNTLGLSGTVSDAGGVSSVQIYDGATLLGAATVSSGNWSYTTAALLAGSHSFTAKATDNAGNTTTTSAVTATVDTLAPTLTSIVATPATAALNAGKTVNLTANFSEVVAVGSGTPTLNLNDGGTATYVSGSGSSLNFTYTVAASQNTSDLQVTGFQGATIQDGAGNIANLSGITATNPVNPTGTLKIDTTMPLVISVVASPSQGTIATGQTVKINLNMSENVTVATSAGKPMLLLNDGGTATYASGSGTSSLVFNYKVPNGQGTPDLQVIGIELPASGAIQDLAGNNASLAGAAADMKLQIGSVTTNATNATISGTQTLELFGASAENIGFASGSTGTLQLDAATSYTGKVSGLALGNALDLANVAYTAGMTAGYQPNTSGPAGGLLTVGSANIALLGNYTASMFVASSDGHGGTNVVDPPLTSTTHTVAAGQVTTDLAVSGIELPTAGSIRDLAGKKARLSGADVNLGLEVNSKPLAITGSTDLQLLGPSNANVAFGAGSRGTLTFDDSQAYTGTVAGLAPGNHIDLADISFGAHTTLGYTPNDSNSGGGLTASDGSHVAKIALLGQYAAASFAMASDGHGGTLITDPPELVAQAQLTKPHA